MKAEIKWVDSLQSLFPEENAIFDSLPIRFVWKKHPNFSTYNVEISRDSLFLISCPYRVTDTTYSYTSIVNSCQLEQGGRYYWRLSSRYDDSGYFRLFRSAIRSFTILPNDPRKPIIHSPADLSSIDSANLLFRWSSIKEAVGYRLSIVEYSGGKTVLDTIVIDTSHLKKYLPKRAYLMRVASIDTAQAEYWSNRIQFQASYKVPGPPRLLTPPDSSTGISPHVLLTWHPEIYGPENCQYVLRIYKEAGELNQNSERVLDTLWLPDTFFYFPAQPNTKYYWWVMGSNYLGTASSYYSFTTGGASSVSRQTPELFDIIPNPISQLALIHLRSTMIGTVRVFVTDILGNRVKVKDDTTGQDIMLDLSEIGDGVYLLEVEGNGIVEQKKIIKFKR